MSLFKSHVTSGWKLTGETGHRIGWLGKIIVTIQEERPSASGFETRWRDARAADFVTPAGDTREEWKA